MKWRKTTATFADFTDDKSTASWLLHADYAKDWQQFQSTGEIQAKKLKRTYRTRGPYHRHRVSGQLLCDLPPPKCLTGVKTVFSTTR